MQSRSRLAIAMSCHFSSFENLKVDVRLLAPILIVKMPELRLKLTQCILILFFLGLAFSEGDKDGFISEKEMAALKKVRTVRNVFANIFRQNNNDYSSSFFSSGQ
jgi:hypothetical protein